MKLKARRCNYSDKDIPKLARIATKEAYNNSVNSGNSVVIRKDNNMISVNKQGKVSFIKKLHPLIKVEKGTKYTING